MYRMNLFLFVALTIVLALIGCNATPTQMPKEVRLTENGGGCGSTVGLKSGDTLELVVEGNPSTGYAWEVGFEVPAVIKSTGEPEYSSYSSTVGTGGAYTFHFVAVAEGQATITLIYHRPFEKNAPDLKTCEVTVNVK